jgi:hypothetical protein
LINAGVRVQGLRELRMNLKKLDVELPLLLRAEMRKVGDKVADRAREKVPVKTGRARDSIRSGVSGANAYVAEGKKSVPYAGWLDFGGVLKPVGKRKNTITRERIKGGRFLYPTINEMHGEIEAGAVAAFEATARKARLK